MEKFHISNIKGYIGYGSYIGNHTVIFSNRQVNNTTDYSEEDTKSIKLTGNYNKKIYNKLKLNTISHNLTITYTSENKIIGFGGVYSKGHNSGKYKDGIYLLEFDDKFKVTKIKLIINRSISLKQYYGTHFDSQTSFTYNPFNKRYYLYNRFNSGKGIRKCQVFTSENYNNNYSKGILVNFDTKDLICIYHQYIYFEDNKFIGIFKYYFGKKKKTNKKKYLYAESSDGINFEIKNMNFFEKFEISMQDSCFVCQNHDINNDYNMYYICNIKTNTIIKYKHIK